MPALQPPLEDRNAETSLSAFAFMPVRAAPATSAVATQRDLVDLFISFLTIERLDLVLAPAAFRRGQLVW